MLPTINGKELIDCSLDDLQIILDNPDYMENEYIDYKKTFSVNEVPKEQKQHEQAEFRSDVCSFANANGGYLIFGVKEEKGIAKELLGITLPNNNPDKFELELKNYLQPIKPRVPYYKIKYIEVSENKYIVILFIQHDSFAPYIHLVEQQNYRAFKRSGNSKAVIEYQELKNMFEQSIILDKEIAKYRKERIDYFVNENEEDRFVLFHIIPETFLDSSYDMPVFALERKHTDFSSIFYPFECDTYSTPIVEGLFFSGRGTDAECRIYNNGIAECFYALENRKILITPQFPTGLLDFRSIWTSIQNTLSRYLYTMRSILKCEKLYACISIIGCKNAITETSDLLENYSAVDRKKLIMNPVMIDDISTGKLNEIELAKMKLEYIISLGLKRNPEIDSLINTIYNKM